MSYFGYMPIVQLFGMCFGVKWFEMHTIRLEDWGSLLEDYNLLPASLTAIRKEFELWSIHT